MEGGSGRSSRHVEVRLGKSFLKFYSGDHGASQYPDAPSYSVFFYRFKPNYLDECVVGDLTENKKDKLRVSYRCPTSGDEYVFSGSYRPGNEMECLLVYDDVEKCYMLEKVDVVYQDLNRKDVATSEKHDGDMILPSAEIVYPSSSVNPSSVAPVPQDATPSTGKKRPRKPRASAKQSAAASPAAAAVATADGTGEVPAKKPRKKRMTKKEREALAAASVHEDSTEAFLRELQGDGDGVEDDNMQKQQQQKQPSSLQFASMVTPATIQRPANALPPVLPSSKGSIVTLPEEPIQLSELQQQQLQQQQQQMAQQTPPQDYIQQNESDGDVSYREESPSSSDQSSDSSNSSSDDFSDDDD